MAKVLDMRVLNLTPDSFWAPSRYNLAVLDSGADIVDIGAVSTRPGAPAVSEEEEWSRLQPVLSALKQRPHPRISIDTERSGIIKRALEYVPDLIINDISAGETDSEMLPLAGRHGLTFIAMHKRGTPATMDTLCDYSEFSCSGYPSGVIPALVAYFEAFSARAAAAGVGDWILDPGLGFAKTPAQCWEILENLEVFQQFGRPILIGASDKRFTNGDTARAESMAIEHGATILRRH